MKLRHFYRIKPSTEQVAIMDTWLEMLRRHLNYALGQRFDWLRRTRCQIDRCIVISEPIGDIPDKFPGYNFQAGELKTTKELFPADKEIHAEVQQQNLKRLEAVCKEKLKAAHQINIKLYKKQKLTVATLNVPLLHRP